MTEQALTPPATTHPVLADPALRRFVAEARAHYGDRLERLVLYGSRARCDHRDDSDYDVAVFLHGFTTRWEEMDPLAWITTEILVDLDAEISARPYPAGRWREEQRPLMQEIARDGVDL